MDVAFYISELLYTNDCVILPEFGGFVSQYAPARIHPINHTFYPPSKQVLFNSKLTRDDGLLTDFIAHRENISYSDSKISTAHFVKSLNDKLDQGQKLTLEKIGSLRKDVEGSLLFDPDIEVNYLEDAFGLNSFVSPPVIRKSSNKRKDGLFVDRKPALNRQTIKRKTVWYSIAIIPILFFVGWIAFYGIKTPQTAQQSTMLDLSEMDTEISPGANNIIPENNPSIESLNLSENPGQIAPDEIKEQPPIVQIKKYYIIGGSFGQESNADNLVQTLIQKGYNASRAGISPSGLHMVSYMTTPDKDEALVNLALIRRDDNPSAWLIRK